VSISTDYLAGSTGGGWRKAIIASGTLRVVTRIASIAVAYLARLKNALSGDIGIVAG
jgi:hypothetical protein